MSVGPSVLRARFAISFSFSLFFTFCCLWFCCLCYQLLSPSPTGFSFSTSTYSTLLYSAADADAGFVLSFLFCRGSFFLLFCVGKCCVVIIRAITIYYSAAVVLASGSAAASTTGSLLRFISGLFVLGRWFCVRAAPATACGITREKEQDERR